MKNIRCTTEKIYVTQKRQYTLHKTENIHCTKEKACAAQNGKYTLHKMGNIRCTKENICCTKKNTDYRKRKMEHSSGLP